MVTPTFENVSGGEYSIQDMKVVGDEVYGYGEVVVQTMSSTGSWDGMYFWYTAAGGMVEADGWYDIEGNPATKSLTVGEAVFMSSDVENVTLNVAGQVAKGEKTVTIDTGYYMIGNLAPVSINLSAVKVAGDEVYGYGEVVVQTMSSTGSWDGMYFWYTAVGGMVEADGWYDIEGVPTEVTLNAGDAVFFSSDVAGVVISLPAAL